MIKIMVDLLTLIWYVRFMDLITYNFCSCSYMMIIFNTPYNGIVGVTLDPERLFEWGTYNIITRPEDLLASGITKL